MALRYVLVGAGPAAVSAAQAIRSQDPAAEILLVSEDPHGYYSRPGIAYFLLNHVPARTLFPFTRDEFARQGITIAQDTVTALDRSAKRLSFARGQDLTYDRLLLATGSAAIPLDIPGAGLDGVVKLDDLADAENILARSRHATTAVVVGGGSTAVEIAEGLRTQKVQVHLLMAGERYWPDVLSESESQIIERRLAARRIQIHTGTGLARIDETGGRVSGVLTGDGTYIPCQMIAVSVGVNPRIQLAKTAGIACDRGILTDAHMQTTDEHVFAAGDVAEVDSDGSGQRTIETLWNSAVTQGRVAGLNMAGGPTHLYSDNVALNVTRIAGLKCAFFGAIGSGRGADLRGLTRGDSEVWRRGSGLRCIELEADHAHLRLCLDSATLRGAVLIGDQSLSLALQELVGARADLSSILGTLAENDGTGAARLEAFRNDWRAANG